MCLNPLADESPLGWELPHVIDRNGVGNDVTTIHQRAGWETKAYLAPSSRNIEKLTGDETPPREKSANTRRGMVYFAGSRLRCFSAQRYLKIENRDFEVNYHVSGHKKQNGDSRYNSEAPEI